MASKKSTATAASSATVTQVDAGRLQISGILDFATVNALLDELGRKIAGHGESTIDLAGVERANSAGLALIVELKAQAVRGGRSLVFENVPASISQIATVCQVDELLFDRSSNPSQS